MGYVGPLWTCWARGLGDNWVELATGQLNENWDHGIEQQKGTMDMHMAHIKTMVWTWTREVTQG